MVMIFVKSRCKMLSVRRITLKEKVNRMKKAIIFLVLVGLMLVALPVFAQDTATPEIVEVKWSEIEPELATYEIEGEFVELEEIPVKFFLPSVFLPVELTDEDREEGFIAYYTTEDEAATIGVQLVETEFKTLEEYADALAKMDVKDAEFVKINDKLALTYINPDNEEISVVSFIDDEGRILEFAFAPISDEGFAAVVMLVSGSIQDVDAK